MEPFRGRLLMERVELWLKKSKQRSEGQAEVLSLMCSHLNDTLCVPDFCMEICEYYYLLK